MNWAKVPQSKSLAESLRVTGETIRLIVSHNKIGGKAKSMDYTQRGGTVLVTREELTPYIKIKDSGANL